MLLKKTAWFWRIGLTIISFILILNVFECNSIIKEETKVMETIDKVQVKGQKEKEVTEQWKKGYDLPVDKREKKEAKNDLKKVMGFIFNIYKKEHKDIDSNVILSDKTVLKIQQKIKEMGYSVATLITYSNMENYKKMDSFLKKCKTGERGSEVVYEIYNDGGIGRMKYIFDGTDLYLINAKGIWNDNDKLSISYIFYTRIKEWEYTKKGWFCYKLCVPEPPEVSDIIDGSCLIRVKPMTKEQRGMSKKCVFCLGYKGNNLLCSNWDADHIEKLDFNGLYEYLYIMKYQAEFPFENYSNGIPKEEFESLIMEYLPVTKKQIRKYAVFDKKNKTYSWEGLGCFNYAPTFFGTSLPEVINIKENKDNTITLTVEAVCDMVICDDAVITHELTIKFAENGSFQYLKNEILNDGIMNIPDYQYRICK